MLAYLPSRRGSLPIERTHDRNLSATAALEAINQEIFGPVGAVISDDRYVAARAGVSWQGAAYWGVPLQADAQISLGLGGQEPDANHKLSRQGASPLFTKLNASAHLTQPVGDVRFDLSARAQWAFGRAKLSSEQFSLDGADAISAFTQGAFSVDAGEVAPLEASRPFALPFAPGAYSLSPYVFAAQGYGAIYDKTAQEQAGTVAYAFGLGARFAFDAPDGFTGAVLGLELASGGSNVPTQRISHRAAVNFSLHY